MQISCNKLVPVEKVLVEMYRESVAYSQLILVQNFLCFIVGALILLYP